MSIPTSDSSLTNIISSEIKASGPMTFARFMDLALYHPEHGYYSAPEPRIGREGDYYTSTDVHPMFGRLIARQLEEMWNILGRPAPFHIVEMGAGKGWLCSDTLEAARENSEFFNAITYVICERSHAMRARQAEITSRLALPDGKIRWANIEELAGIEGCFLSNELVDALPVHRVVRRGDTLREVFVDLDSDGFIEREEAPSCAELADYFSFVGVELEDGQQAEIRLAARDWLREVRRALRRGFVLTIDYGHDAEHLYAPRKFRGTLMCYHCHTANEEPLMRVGEQDMTAHVDFTALMKWGTTAGLDVTGFTNQAFFLLSLGLDEAMRLEALTVMAPDAALKQSMSLKRLISPDGLGAFRVLIQHAGIEKPALRGLTFLP